MLLAMLLVLGAFVVVSLGSASIEGGDVDGIFPIFAGILMGAIAMVLAYNSGTGRVCCADLQKNAIYATVSSAAVDGKYVVVTRLQSGNGELHAYLLPKDPPKMFKATGNEADPFVPFP